MYKRIVVPLDGSPLAEQALPHAVAQASQFGTDLVLLKVLAPLHDVVFSSPAAVRAAEAMTAQLARDYLDGIAAGIREQGVAVQVAAVEGEPRRAPSRVDPDHRGQIGHGFVPRRHPPERRQASGGISTRTPCCQDSIPFSAS